ncbi:hypothetical protein HRR83_001488 [Exophiala dermatitidis]|uniref:D-amino-acid dehydrogenase n=2 Tax=Exophiala dermatitidis TaxID=5970 RepID=H6C696_EXODN|nr:D-amino-acid dehydrogenase [Exophiala dermatitidis NIH/UT8656]KAJ4522978.1 hypothetical protein HRR75_001374 [Exophiala dermatitidis]EHY59242.1 D-amino-acid dehydrogenase [Exophiala dermatitidis NIH/UT8656]KAJ4526297.1 hypothetical protein HRR74_001492 [Exophiala dermatitidis]KAJ4526760.1 hypothetical protein HRR73_001555 [Exophiala dermatitidis]KAJ4532466.1 hypothetical protein HRR76_007458 [Exophiala dermatitidis]
MSTVILGGGIIGLSTAYYLAQQKKAAGSADSIHIIESSPVFFESASGYAGGFLALDWFVPEVSDLGALSYRLHRELAEKHNGPRRWGYGGSHVYSLNVPDSGTGRKARGEDWLLAGTSRANAVKANSEAEKGRHVAHGDTVNPDGTPAVFTPQREGTYETIAGPEECAQIEPREFCEFLLDECKKMGVEVHLSTKATGILTDGNGVFQGLKLQSTDKNRPIEIHIRCKDVVLAAGVWTPRVFEALFPQSKVRLPIEALAGHSITVRSPRYKTPFIDPSNRRIGGKDNWLCYSIYCPPGPHWSYAMEAYARLARNGETELWLGGLNHSNFPVPELAVDVKKMLDPECIKDLRKATVQVSGLTKEGDDLNQDDLETIREALCLRPVTPTGKPFIGKVPEKYLGGVRCEQGGIWIACGHGPWGITLSLGTGLVMSEMLLGKKPSADVEGLQLSSVSGVRSSL